MKPVCQTIFGTGRGNCFAACVASILELPIEEVPNFCADTPEGENWYPPFQAWAAARGVIGMPFVLPSADCEVLLRLARDEFPALPCIVFGATENGGHCVVFQAGAPVHDPNPRREQRGALFSLSMVLFLVRSPA